MKSRGVAQQLSYAMLHAFCALPPTIAGTDNTHDEDCKGLQRKTTTPMTNKKSTLG
jgi:hypothetical protein